jgi:hypothetical protein
MQPAAGTRPLAPAAPLCPYSRAVRRPRRTGVGAPAEDPLAFKHILIAVPTMAGLMKARTTTTLVLLMRQLTRAGVAVEYLNIDSSDIVYARNFFAREMLRHEELDGLLFVDSDMQFRPALVHKMINLGADIMAAAYPKRALDMDRYSRALAAAGAFSPEVKARTLANSYNFTVVPSWTAPLPKEMDVVAGFAKMAGAGMGCTLISRVALQAMIDGGVVERRKDIIDGDEQLAWGFFDCIKVGDITLSEDFSFCWRWTKLLGRDLWVNIDEVVTHLGDFSHEARYMDRLAKVETDEGAAPPPAPRAPDTTGVEITADTIVIDADLIGGAGR